MNIDRFSLPLQRSRLLIALTIGVLTFALSACGGGSDGKSKSSSSSSSTPFSSSSYSAASIPNNGTGIWPSVKVTGTQIKTLTFEWSAVEGATSYRLMKNQGGNSEYVQVGDTITSTTTPVSATDTIGVHVHDWINTRYKVQSCVDTDCTDSDVTFTATEMIKTIGYVKASNTETGDFFGWSIALSGDGNTLAVGAPAEDSNATGVNGDDGSNTSDNAGAVYIFIKNETGLWEQQAYLKASNTEQPNLNTARFLPNDRFGYRVALSDDGNTLAVTALLEDSPSYGINCNQDNFEITENQASKSSSSNPVSPYIKAANYDMGAVYMFKRTGSEWEQDAFVKPRFSLFHLQVEEGLRFGEALALSGDGKTLAVGTTSDGLPINGTIIFSSSSSSQGCYVYYPSSSSSSISTSTSSSSSSSSKTSSSKSNSSLPGGSFSGAVYIYIYGENGWEEEGYIKADNAQVSDAFGASIDLSTDGNTLAVGAIGEDSIATGVNGNQADNSCYYAKDDLFVIDPACEESRFNPRLDNGAVYIFSRSDKNWTQQAYLKPAVTFIRTAFGYSVSLSGDGSTLAVGAIGDASTDTGVNADPAQIDYTTNSDNTYLNSGAVYVFARSGSTWARQSYIKLDVNSRLKGFGESISLSQDGNLLAAGSFRDSSNATGINGNEGNTSADRAGAVFIYKRDAGAWSRVSYVKASNTDADDRFGLNVDLSADGSTMAVGAHRESSDDIGVNGDQNSNDAEASGAVYIY